MRELERCTARDNLHGLQCAVIGPHDVIINSKGQRATSHHNEHGLWSTPIHDLQVATAFPQDPEAIGRMLDKARFATPEDVAAGGSNSEEELLIALRFGYLRGIEGAPGTNDLGFTLWPNGARAFRAGYAWAEREKAASIIQTAREGQR